MSMPSPCYALLLAADPVGALSCTISSILPYGLAWLFIGMIIWAAVKKKTEGYAISGIILILYLALLIPANLVPVSVQPFLGLLIGLMITIMIVLIITKKG
jgi:hypothetical protein